MARVCLALCVLAALAVDLRVAAASAQPRPSGGAISSEEPTKTAATAATAGEEAAPVKETPQRRRRASGRRYCTSRTTTRRGSCGRSRAHAEKVSDDPRARSPNEQHPTHPREKPD